MTVAQDNRSVDAIGDLEQTLEDTHLLLVAVKSRCDELESVYQNLVSAMTTLKNQMFQSDYIGEAIPPVDLQECANQQEIDRTAPESTLAGVSSANLDLSRCMNLRERLEVIAIANRGLLDLAHARDTILAAGVSRSTPSSLRTEILKCVKRNPQDWEQVWSHVYRYKLFAAQDDEGL